jgi:hypothetical protein
MPPASFVLAGNDSRCALALLGGLAQRLGLPLVFSSAAQRLSNGEAADPARNVAGAPTGSTVQSG